MNIWSGSSSVAVAAEGGAPPAAAPGVTGGLLIA